MAASDILRQMVNNAPLQVEDIQANIDNLQTIIDDLNDQIDAVQNGLCGSAESQLTAYLDGTKLAEIEALYDNGSNTPFSVDYGADYGTIDYTTGGITDFTIIDVTGNVEYEYLGTNWDSDSMIVKLIDDFDFGNDYLTRPLSSSATYGLIASRDNYTTGKTILQTNQTKVSDSITAMEDYAS